MTVCLEARDQAFMSGFMSSIIRPHPGLKSIAHEFESCYCKAALPQVVSLVEVGTYQPTGHRIRKRTKNGHEVCGAYVTTPHRPMTVLSD